MTGSLTGHISILQYILQTKSAGGRGGGRGAGGGGRTEVRRRSRGEGEMLKSGEVNQGHKGVCV